MCGDFNIHFGDTENQIAQRFENILDAMCLYQSVSFSTHRDGNILDLIIIDGLFKENWLTCYQGDLISAHFVVHGEFLWKTVPSLPFVKQIRNFKKIDFLTPAAD